MINALKVVLAVIATLSFYPLHYTIGEEEGKLEVTLILASEALTNITVEVMSIDKSAIGELSNIYHFQRHRKLKSYRGQYIMIVLDDRLVRFTIYLLNLGGLGHCDPLPMIVYVITVGGGIDYASGPYTIKIPVGATNVSFYISIINDALHEGDEEFFLAINSSSLLNEEEVTTRGQAIVTIVNDDSK